MTNSRLLLSASFLSSFGDWFYVVALGGLAYQTSGTLGAAWVAAVRYAPSLFMPLMSARALCWGSARGWLIALDITRAALMLGIAQLARAGQVGAFFFVLVFLCASAGGLFRPIRMTLLPSALKSDTLQKFYGTDGFLNTVALMGAPALGGVLAAYLGVAGLLQLNALSFLLSAFLIVRVTLERKDGSIRGAESSSLGGAPSLPMSFWLGVALYSLSHVLVGATWTVLPEFAARITHGSESGLGLLTSWVGVFSALGMLQAGRIQGIQKDRGAALAVVAFAALFGVLSGVLFLKAGGLVVALWSLLTLGAAVYAANFAEPWFWTHWQESIGAGIKPRAFGIIDSFSIGGLLVGSLGTGYLSKQWSTQFAMQAVAGVVLLASVLVALQWGVRRAQHVRV